MEKIAVIYWSGTGNTEMMASAIAEGIESAGKSAEKMTVDAFNAASFDSYGKIAFGCPAMGGEELEETEFEPFFAGIESLLKGKKVALFGSYDWGDGEWMRLWQDRVVSDGAVLSEEGLIVHMTPDEEALQTCADFGKRFASL